MKALYTVVAVVGIAIAGGTAWWFQHRAPAGGDAARAPAGPGGTAPGGTARAPGGAPGGPPGAGGPVAVEVGRAMAMTIEDDVAAVGTLRARQSVTLRPEISGRIVALGFRDGERVKAGQLLVQLDDRLQAAQLQQAQAQGAIARTNLQRNRELLAENFISKSAVDQSAANLEVAEAQVALAQAQFARTKIVAPFAGVVGIRSVDIGDFVKDGADLVAIEDTSSLWVDYRLPERFIPRVRPGQVVEVVLDAAPQTRLQARVEALDSQVDADGRSLLVRARLDNRDGGLKSGMFARTRTVFASRPNAVVVPEAARGAHRRAPAGPRRNPRRRRRRRPGRDGRSGPAHARRRAAVARDRDRRCGRAAGGGRRVGSKRSGGATQRPGGLRPQPSGFDDAHLRDLDPPSGARHRDVAAARADRPGVVQSAQRARVPAHRRAAGE
ncbi:MAG: efflux RND transporter periplasmic adaptor subunit, partial [Burkholderiaceae bacterium]|nr:efflux RND transporter periplasmic adaptor subunit [Burkholderiaceae bacterium]